MNSFDPTEYTVGELMKLSESRPDIWAEIDTWIIEQSEKPTRLEGGTEVRALFNIESLVTS